MLRIVSKLSWASLLAALAAGMSFAMLDWHTAAGPNSHAGSVTGVIDGVTFEGDQYYVHGWACQRAIEAPSASISTRIIRRVASRRERMSWQARPT